MLDPQFLSILRCPENHIPLREADAALLAHVNRAIAGGLVKNRLGQTVSTAFEGGLVREDGAVFYPIEDGIPRLLADEGIPLDQLP
jgi:uncharacterized protein YbaR (Trm112 family)